MTASIGALLLVFASLAAADEVDRLSWVPEAKDYLPVYTLDLHRLGAEIAYDRDQTAAITMPFDRVAYFLELRQPEAMLLYVWVSMDAFTDDPRKLGVPTGWTFQRRVGHVRVVSNASAVTSGEMEQGNLEFWPNNYGPANSADVPGASMDAYDWGDNMDPRVRSGYGSMQVHNFAAKQTIFAINGWRLADRADIGIGGSTTGTDWTFAHNAASYQTRRLRVLVHPRP